MKKLANSKERLLGLDYGSSRIGTALGDAGLTMPIETLDGADEDGAVSRIVRMVYENKITKIVIGLPINAEGKLTSQALEVKNFVRKLRLKVKVPIVTVNEYMSSREALAKAVGYGVSQKRRSTLDSLSAEIILKRYYEEKA